MSSALFSYGGDSGVTAKPLQTVTLPPPETNLGGYANGRQILHLLLAQKAELDGD